MIRDQREIKNAAKPLGPAASVRSCGNFHTISEGRLLQSHLIEDSIRLQIGTTSFIPANWQCLASEGHPSLPKKRNLDQWKGGRRLVILCDQNIAPVIPSNDKSCPSIIRIEDGSLSELGDSLCCLLGDHTLPEGSEIAMGSLSHLMRAGLSAYADIMVTECRRFRSMFKNQGVVVPFAPIPLCGTDDPNLVKRLTSLTYYMDSLSDGGHVQYNNEIRGYINEQILENTVLVARSTPTLSNPTNL